VVAVGGVIASGKSTIAVALGLALGAPVVESDRTRKHLLGVAPTEAVHDAEWSGAYGSDATEQVYAELLRRARIVVESRRPIVLDASFRSEADRRAVRELAAELGVPFFFVECRVDHDVCRERLRARARGASISDGREQIFEAFVARWEPVEELRSEEHIVVDTTLDLATSVEEARRRLPSWPEPS
jgi:predicted kinase